jgi:hypothetical protein
VFCLATLVHPDKSSCCTTQAEFAVEGVTLGKMGGERQLSLDKVIRVDARSKAAAGGNLCHRLPSHTRQATRPVKSIGIEIPGIGGVADRFERRNGGIGRLPVGRWDRLGLTRHQRPLPAQYLNIIRREPRRRSVDECLNAER